MIRIEFVGNLGEDAMYYTSKDGNQFLGFNVAINTKYKDATGTLQSKTQWVQCTRNGVQNVDKYLGKGVQVYISGTPETHHWQGQDGSAHSSLVCRVRELQLLGKAGDAASDGGAQQ